ncbi:MAG: biotin transporter BioY [Elusimicrobiota bacterium]
MEKIKKLIHVSIFAALTAVGAYIVIPIGPVPITLQNVFVLLSGYALGSKKGALSQIVYIIIGLIGIPVYARGGSGLGHLLGPTGGYIFGFVVSAVCVGGIIKNPRNAGIIRIFLGFALGILAIYVCGTIQLMFVSELNLHKAVSIGVLPFIPIDLLKIIILTIIIRYIRQEKA